ncbi:tetrahydrofolate dehydrogenase/cyclohydrolase catalytic domain-containing protein [Pelatocladus sp. BLCC-F211]|uniref:tetrahydrofolate dehydrogenase/cyclohydrolase catalytic domain-containing protein n=1 Tax=Pelatocladus sp. BLCC-F211 TaxID=3342752 RepID=UPI0035BAB923
MGLIDGNIIKEYVKNECKKYQEQLQGTEITIVRFNPPAYLLAENQQLSDRDNIKKGMYKAALTSENQKVATFESIGVKVNREILSPETTTVEQFENILQRINQSEQVKAAIIQFPIPAEFEDSIQILSPEKDIDIVRESPNSLFNAPATSEGVARIIECYAQPDSNVAVIGGGGFIGSGVINYLESKNINCFVIEYGDDLSRTREADIVATVTGVPGLTTAYVLGQHRLVVDSGFFPGETKQDLPKGDVDRSAYNIPQNITPVPGGIGPTEMAILAERFVKMELRIELPKWNYQQLQQEQQQRATVLAPIAITLFQQQTKAYPESIRRPKENLEVLQGNHYKLSYNRNTQALSLSRSNENTTLIKINLVNNQIEIARGLTAEDMNKWQQIQALINSPRQYPNDRSFER